MSPLLRALTYGHTSVEPVTQAMLLQCYIALDAFRRGHGSRDLFSTLGRTLLIAEELGRLGHQASALGDIESAHAALMHINAEEHAGGGWRVCDADYLPLSTGLAVFSEQLNAASLNDIAKAEARMLEGLVGSARTTRQVEELASRLFIAGLATVECRRTAVTLSARARSVLRHTHARAPS